ncbi:uncharacterized protein [Henckelia pumila]|uniref:uncharacterized protein n=1 Tax=Henckelia pumila TaxID=405737 RepID=UPI003C6E0481
MRIYVFKIPGVTEALKDQAPNCEHRYCVRHMYQNMSLKYKGDELRKLLWRAASTGNKKEFTSWMKKIEAADRKENPQHVTAFEWLGKIPPVHWARSHFFSSCLCDVIVNNMAESFNSYVLEARDMPIISMFDWIRRKLMVRMQEKRIGMEKYDGDICPNILTKIRKNQDLAGDCSTLYCGLKEYEVETGTEQYIVDLEKMVCTCGMFQLCGYPCAHACASIIQHRLNIDDFVSPCYKKEAYLRTYAYIIHGVPGESGYIKTDFEPLQPPPIVKAKGRPKKKRRKGVDENEGSLTRRGLTHTCYKCLQQGHNKKTCTKPTNPRSKFYKGADGEQGKKKKSQSLTLQQQTSIVVGT